MKAFLSVVSLELKAVFRSKALFVLVAAAVGWVLLLPHVARGDGTDSGAFALRVLYGLGAVFAIVLVSFAAAAAGSLSRDRAAKRLQLTMVRPVRHSIVALGRMAALSASAALVLGAACLAVLAREGNSRTCDHVYAPKLEDPAAAAERMYAEYCEKYPDFRRNSEEVGVGNVKNYLMLTARDEYQSVAKGETATWEFPSAPARGRFSARVMMTDLYGRLDKVNGVFRLGNAVGEMNRLNKTVARVALSAAAGGGESESGNRVLSFENKGETDVSFQPRRDIRLLAGADGFAWNLLRAWLVMSAVVSMAIALATFLGSCLSRSVAVFCVSAILAASAVAPSALDQAPDPFTATGVERASLRLTAFADAATGPLNSYSPITSLSEGECVEQSDVLSSALFGFAAFPFVFALLAGLVMSRVAGRE